MAELRTLPLTLSAFDAIWHLLGVTPTESEQVRLAEYVQAGGALLVNGFHPGLLGRVLLEAVPATTGHYADPPYLFREIGPDGLSLLPNPLTSLVFQTIPKTVRGVAEGNVLVRSENGFTIGAAWSRSQLVGGRGHLVAFSGASWVKNPEWNLAVFENLHAYLLQGAPGFVEGTVRFPDGSPVPNARLRLAQLDSETFTDASGNFLLDVTSRLPEAGLEASVRWRQRVYRGTASLAPTPGSVARADIVLRRSPDVLLFGDSHSAIQSLARELASILPSGVRIRTERQLPSDLERFGTIWHVGTSAPLSAETRTRLAEFVRSGGGLHLSAELLGSNEGLARSIMELLGLLLPEEPWIDPVQSPGPHRFEPSVKHAATRLPRQLTEWSPEGAARILGLRADDVLVRDGTGAPCGALWDERDLAGQGRLTLLMDGGWFLRASPSRTMVIENIQNFLSPSEGYLQDR